MSARRLSWLASANTATTDFPIENLPFGIFSRAGEAPRVGVAIGDAIVDLSVLARAGVLCPDYLPEFAVDSLNGLIALGQPVWRDVREKLTRWLAADADSPSSLRATALVPLSEAVMHLPIAVAGYTDFYSSREHAIHCGSLFRDPENALSPNWHELPVAYNSRASSVVVSGTPVRRPLGQSAVPGAARPGFGPCAKLDYELEMAFVIGKPSTLGTSIRVSQAPEHLFGMVLLNDWSARDFQQWESAPLGPFNSKTFGTSISPWVVTMDALERFRCAQPLQSPEPIDYLRHETDGAYDITLEVAIRPAGDVAPTTTGRTNFRGMYWTMAQQLAHHTVSGCNVRIGDLIGSGTISGAANDALGCLLERTRNGTQPFEIGGRKRLFLEDGDEVIMRGWCQGDGFRIGFGAVSGRVLPAMGWTR